MAYVYRYSTQGNQTHIFFDTDQGCDVSMNSDDVTALKLKAEEAKTSVDSVPLEVMSKIAADVAVKK